MRDTVLGGVELHEGDLLSVRFGAANRDETQFPAAERIDLHRSAARQAPRAWRRPASFIGAQLARQEIVSALTGLLDRYDAFALTPGRPQPEYAPSFFGRNLRQFFVTLTPRRATGD